MIPELIVSGLYATSAYYLHNLQTTECSCAMNDTRKYLFIFSCIAVVYTLFYTMFRNQYLRLLMKYPIVWLVPLAYFIAACVWFVYAIQYVNELKKKDCKCSKSLGRDVLYSLGILEAVSFGIIMVTLLGTGYFYMTLNSEGKSSFVKGFKSGFKNAIAK